VNGRNHAHGFSGGLTVTRTCVALLLFMSLCTSANAGQQGSQPLASATAVPGFVAANIAPASDPADAPAPGIVVTTPDRVRPAALPSMYVSFVALQGYDVYATERALKLGAGEGNPLMAGVVKNPVALVAVKGATTFASVYAAERLWRDNRRGAAVVLMLVTNGLMVCVAAHNASVLHAQRR
jgi:hypothetical protein